MRSIRAFLVGFIIAASVVTLVLALFLAFGERLRPPSLAAAGATSAVALESVEYDDAATVRLTLTHEEGEALTSPAAGRLTTFACEEGQTLASGQIAASINGESILALATSIPPYRDLAVGDQGEDVRALQQALAELGYSIRPDGHMGEYTLRLLTTLLDGSKTATHESIASSRLLWLPSARITVAECLAGVGAQMETTTPLMRLPGRITSAQLSELPSQYAPGARVLTVPGIDTPLAVGEGQSIPEEQLGTLGAADLSSAEQSASSAGAGSSDNGTGAATRSLQVRWLLAEPISAVSLPPSALYQLSDRQACLQSPDGEPYPVTVVGSHLGATLVTLDSSAGAAASLPTQATLNPDGALSCR